MISHRRHLRTLGAAILAALLMVAVSACGDEGSSSDAKAVMGEAAAGPDVMAGAPASEACYKMSFLKSQAATNNGTPVDCYQDHNTQTYLIDTFPETTTSVDTSYIIKQCRKELPKAMGIGKLKIDGTIFSFIYFEPTGGQWDAGARWFRCDVIAKSDGGLRNLEETNAPFYAYTEVQDKYSRCLREINADGDLVATTCDKDHDFRWVKSYEVRGPDFPGADKAESEAKDKCNTLIATNRYAYSWPNETEWSYGDHFTACFKFVG